MTSKQDIQKSIYYQRHHDDEGYDEITIKTIPRYKTSGLSGDEWRVSAEVQFKRKGEVIFCRRFSKVQTAVNALPWFFMTAGELGGEDYDLKAYDRTRSKCAQAGCSNEATTEYRLKKEYADGHPVEIGEWCEKRIKFCEKHLTRGDCGLEDSDSNYEHISGPTKTDWHGADIRESAQVVVNVESPDKIGEAVAQVMKDKAWDQSRN